MKVFDRQLGQPNRNDLKTWKRQVEEHINYMQERLEYAFRLQREGGADHGDV